MRSLVIICKKNIYRVYSTYIKEDNIAVSISVMHVNAIEPLRKLNIA